MRFRVGSGANTTDGGMLALNQAAEVRFRVTVDAGFAGTQITNTVTVAHGSQTFPNDPDQNVSGSTNNDIPLAQNPNLDIAKTGPATATVGVAYDYVITVSNTGAAATTAQATVTDTVPAGLTINGTPAGCTVAGQVVTCNVAAGLSNVAPNNTATVSYTHLDVYKRQCRHLPDVGRREVWWVRLSCHAWYEEQASMTEMIWTSPG